jgi:hypothetical protein
MYSRRQRISWPKGCSGGRTKLQVSHSQVLQGNRREVADSVVTLSFAVPPRPSRWIPAATSARPLRPIEKTKHPWTSLRPPTLAVTSYSQTSGSILQMCRSSSCVPGRRVCKSSWGIIKVGTDGSSCDISELIPRLALPFLSDPDANSEAPIVSLRFAVICCTSLTLCSTRPTHTSWLRPKRSTTKAYHTRSNTSPFWDPSLTRTKVFSTTSPVGLAQTGPARGRVSITRRTRSVAPDQKGYFGCFPSF